MSQEQQRLWNELIERSFHPSEWFSYDLDDWGDVQQDRKGVIMWVYRVNDDNLHEVGYWTPDKEWVADSQWRSKEDAAQRVHWLNGGNRGEIRHDGR